MAVCKVKSSLCLLRVLCVSVVKNATQTLTREVQRTLSTHRVLEVCRTPLVAKFETLNLSSCCIRQLIDENVSSRLLESRQGGPSEFTQCRFKLSNTFVG